jgi:signal transduction histidine kinase
MPWMEAGLIVAFMGVALMAFRSMKRSEQRSIWVGMAKETAHQLGTPLTSINGWLALLREQDAVYATARAAAAAGVTPVDPSLDRAGVLTELQRDLERLAKVSERFNQIGSRPRMVPVRADEIVERVCVYFRRRLPQLGRPVRLETQVGEVEPAPLNAELLEWVCENLIKNALDAIDKTPGVVQVSCQQVPETRRIEILVRDNGKGMPPAVQRRIFEPGFTTKQGGWGMGMVLVRRIVEEYHGGRVEVLKSSPGEGSTLRVSLPMR